MQVKPKDFANFDYLQRLAIVIVLENLLQVSGFKQYSALSANDTDQMEIDSYYKKLDLIRYLNRLVFDIKNGPTGTKKRMAWINKQPKTVEMIAYTMRNMM